MLYFARTRQYKPYFLIFIHIYLVLSFPLSCKAKLVSINGNEVNIRSGPSTNSKLKWVVGRGFPLRVLRSKGNWLHVIDFENETGWVYAPLTSRKPHLVVKKKNINVRNGPGTRFYVVAKAQYGVVFETLKQVKGWAKVKHETGIVGWVSRKLVWGW